MNQAASYEKQLPVRHAGLTLAGFVTLALFAPSVLRLEEETATVSMRVLLAGAVTTLLVLVLTRSLAHRHRFVLRALAMGSSAVEASDLEGLRLLAQRAVVGQLALSLVANGLLGSSWLRPEGLPAEVAHELAVLGTATSLAATVPALVLGQRLLGRLLMVAPAESVAQEVSDLEHQGRALAIGRRTLVLAVVIPVGLVGVGGVLASFAHLRALTEESRTVTALTLARGVIGPGELKRSPGRLAALAMARRSGYDIQLSEDAKDRSVHRGDEVITHTVALPHGSAVVSFRSSVPVAISAPLAALALSLVLGAWACAHALSGLVSRDLRRSAARLRTLGTESVRRGASAEHFVARFGVVARLERSALSLAERFAVFAAAQERALEAKDAARRARGLFFASVSHDLKTPLNAIIGFADAIDSEKLQPAQRESLELISTRGRELVALIETILDAARIEAGQLALSRSEISVASLCATAISRARELAGNQGLLRVEMPDDLPAMEADATHLPRALGVILAHALKSPTLEGNSASILLRVTLLEGAKRLRFEIHHGDAALNKADLESLFARQARARAKGLVLGLGLARSIVELHEGQLEVMGAAHEAVRLQLDLPLLSSRQRTARCSSAPPHGAPVSG